MKACQRAYKVATAAIDSAYGYSDSVLFKPTLATEPYTYRPTRSGALSYFIGTVCLNMVGKASEQFPPGNNDGTMFQEHGFAVNNYKDHTGWTAVEYDFDKFLYRIDPDRGPSCETAIAQGQMCVVHHNTDLGMFYNKYPDSTCFILCQFTFFSFSSCGLFSFVAHSPSFLFTFVRFDSQANPVSTKHLDSMILLLVWEQVRESRPIIHPKLCTWSRLR